MKVIAKSASAFLIEFEDGCGRVLDLEQERLFPPNSVDSILARGYWEPFTGDPAPVLAQVGELEDCDAPAGFIPSPRPEKTAMGSSRLGR